MLKEKKIQIIPVISGQCLKAHSQLASKHVLNVLILWNEHVSNVLWYWEYALTGCSSRFSIYYLERLPIVRELLQQFIKACSQSAFTHCCSSTLTIYSYFQLASWEYAWTPYQSTLSISKHIWNVLIFENKHVENEPTSTLRMCF